jgi:transcriptional regulator of arginine metabolism
MNRQIKSADPGVAQASPRTMNARRARVAVLLAGSSIGSQEELGILLAKEGISVTQATLSRDLDALGAIKRMDASGNVRYEITEVIEADTSLPMSLSEQSLARAAHELLLRAEAAGNIAVLHTPPGAAQFFAGHLDRSAVFDSVGTVAGDDTVIIITRSPDDAVKLCQSLLELAEAKG